MKQHIIVIAVVSAISALVITACSSDESSDAAGGNGSCASTCKKSIALNCSSGEHDQAACEQSCAQQKSGCDSANLASTFQKYLDCVEGSAMECGSTTQAPSSPGCVQEGLATLACAVGGKGDAGGTSTGSGKGMTGDPCSHDTDCFGVRKCKDNACVGMNTCTNDGSCGALKCKDFGGSDGKLCWVACTNDSVCASSGYVDNTKCVSGWCAKP